MSVVQRTEIDGVPVLWADVPGSQVLTATLYVGCGTRDESFTTIGVTHMVEHLAMGTLPRVHHGRNACVELDTTQFFAEGRPEQVRDFLEGVCRALADLPLARIERESGVLEAENGVAAHPVVASLLTRRFGIAGPGLEFWTGPGHHGVGQDAVRDHAARFFHRRNAVVVLDGPPPEGLRLPLPDGAAPAPRSWTALPEVGPSWSSAPMLPGVGLALTCDRQDRGAHLGVVLLAEALMRRAREEHGISYHVGDDVVEHADEVLERIVHLDAREGHELLAAQVLWDTARELATVGPDPADVAHEIQGFRELFADPRAMVGELDWAARELLAGREGRSPREVLEQIEQVTPQQVAKSMASVLRTALLVVPEGVEPHITDLYGRPVPRREGGQRDAVPDGRTLRPGIGARLRMRAARRVRLVHAADGFALVDLDDGVRGVRFDDVVGVERCHLGRVLYGRDGGVVPVTTELWSGVDGAVAEIDRRVPQTLWFDSPHPHEH